MIIIGETSKKQQADVFDCAASRDCDPGRFEFGYVPPDRPHITHQQLGKVFLTQQTTLFVRLVTDSQQTPPARFYAGILVLVWQTIPILVMKQRQCHGYHLAVFVRLARRFADTDT